MPVHDHDDHVAEQDDKHDDEHDRGLVYDLVTLRARAAAPRRLERRGALKLLGGAGAGLLLAACGSDGGTGAAGTTTSSAAGGGSSTTAATGTTAATATTSGGDTVTEAIPEETGGPFPGDGSNGPNVLTESGVVRRDIRSSFGGYSGTAEGVPLTVDLRIVAAGTGAALPGAALYLWHCDANGGYSLYSSGVTDQNYLRGVQEADADGALQFLSIYPAAYDGRWPHMHFEVFESLDAATSANGKLVTSQLALPEDVSSQVYEGDSRYAQSVANLSRTSLESDNVFSDGYDLQVPTVTGDLESGFALALTIAVR